MNVDFYLWNNGYVYVVWLWLYFSDQLLAAILSDSGFLLTHLFSPFCGRLKIVGFGHRNILFPEVFARDMCLSTLFESLDSCVDLGWFIIWTLSIHIILLSLCFILNCIFISDYRTDGGFWIVDSSSSRLQHNSNNNNQNNSLSHSHSHSRKTGRMGKAGRTLQRWGDSEQSCA